jgi:hypothetical protein
LRFLTSLAAAAFSSLRPITPIEKQIALLPPAQNFIIWLHRVFVSPWTRYDAVWFWQILTRGYVAGDGSTSFHPLYLWLSYPLYRLGLDASLSLLITSSLATLAFLGIFYLYARLDHKSTTAWTALLLLATFPLAFILYAPYTESLFLLFAVSALYTIRRKQWGQAALFSFLATLTRQQGIFLSIPLVWEIWQASKKSLHAIGKTWTNWLAPLAAPLVLVAWGTYRIGFLHEKSLDLSSFQGLIYSAFLSPSANKVIADQAFRWPWDALILAFSKVIHTPDLSGFINLTLGIGFLIAFFLAWKHLMDAERIYCLVIILVSFSVTTGQYAYVSLPRHLFLAFPVFIGLAEALQKIQSKIFLIACQTIGYIFLIYCCVLNGWIP